MLYNLSGRITVSGKSYTEVWLLKIAGFDEPYNGLLKAERLERSENELLETREIEEKASSSWKKRVAFVLCNHEKGSIVKAIEDCFKRVVSSSPRGLYICFIIFLFLV